MSTPDPPTARIAPSDRMPPWLPRAVLMILAMIAGFRLLGWTLDQLRTLLIDLLLAFFLALAFEPAVDRLARRGMRRGLATGIAFVVVFLACAGFVALVGSLLIDQIVELARNLPDYVDSLVAWANRTFDTELTVEEIQDDLFKDSGTVQGYAQTVADNALGFSAAIVGGVFQLFTIALFTFYFTAEGPRMRRAVCSLLPPERQGEVLRGWEIAIDKTGGYLYSRAALALISAFAHYIAFLVLDVPYAVPLALWVGLISQFVPTVGTYIAIVLPALIALTVSPLTVLWVVLFATAYQQFENYLLHPRITARTVEIHPAVAFGAVIAGASLLGVVGALVAIPVAATAQAFVGSYLHRYAVPQHHLTPDETRPPREPGRLSRLWRRGQDQKRNSR
ncbi:AI-2E family transporter [Embleya sp. NBC_00896]|uniref:AI-2E family transporter n=1 Tax=Embleya sp. NBC_00896 TaxID=2975961 RepID=UPI00386F1BF4|nr:AI-2E family transporter [Embleya sp. NBC_00896]